jgi:hypothetical protein
MGSLAWNSHNSFIIYGWWDKWWSDRIKKEIIDGYFDLNWWKNCFKLKPAMDQVFRKRLNAYGKKW